MSDAAIRKYVDESERWLVQATLDAELRAELEELKARYAANPADEEIAGEISDRFYRFMEFGTAGMRGIMGAGTNRVNVHTVAKISQGFAEYLNGVNSQPRVVLAYDNRKNSERFARIAAEVFAANGIETFLFDSLSATPLLSFAVRELGADGGVVITASHNNKAYNGYKIYDETGCQCLPDVAEKVAAKIDAVDIWTGVRQEGESAKIHMIGAELREAFIARVLQESLTAGALSDVSAVYTPLNGTGNLLVPPLLARAGIEKLSVVPEQEKPDSAFSTCPDPNPEKPAALALGLALCEKLQGAGDAPDVLIATDPDADRLGAMVLHEGEYRRLSGNQVGVLLLDYIISCRERDGSMPKQPVFSTTVVSTPLAEKIAESHGIETRKVLTGTKNIGALINKLEDIGEAERFILGFEESCGYMAGDYARDKDAQCAALLFLEALGVQKKRGKTLIDRMEELFAEYDYYIDAVDEITKPGEQGAAEIKAIMAKLREQETLGKFGVRVLRKIDYLSDMVEGIPAADVLEFVLANGSKLLARPSGTEPKCKIYYTGVGGTEAVARAALAALQTSVQNITKFLQNI